MTSFQKSSVTTALQLNGTKLRNGIPCVSSGVPSLDHVLGGSIPVGSVFMIEEDVLRNYSRVISKFFLAEGVVSKHALLLASLDDDPFELLKELPAPTFGETESDLPRAENENDELKIAWRYESQRAVESSFGTNSNFGHHFDLSKHIDADTIKTCDTFCWSNIPLNRECEGFHNPLFYDLLKTISDHVNRKGFQLADNQARNVLRICVSSLGSPVWSAHEGEDGYNQSDSGGDIIKFMYCLRMMLRGTAAVALITVPTHLFEDDLIVKRLLNSADNAVKLESFAGSHRETNPAFKEYHGLLHITKLSAINTLVPHLPPSLDLAFKLRRKKFLVEKLHLPPELQESSEREQDDVTATAPSCSSFRKKDIDF